MRNKVSSAPNELVGGVIGLQVPSVFIRPVKRHFLECELKTADDLIEEYKEYAEAQMDGSDGADSAIRLKLIWLLERLQESVL